jgi:hypothetical protein
VQRAALLAPAKPSAPGELQARIAHAAARLGPDRDDSIARLFVEIAQADLAAPAADAAAATTEARAGPAPGAIAAAVEAAVLPRYHAAIAPAVSRPAPPAAGVTVTLVRWPYT